MGAQFCREIPKEPNSPLPQQSETESYGQNQEQFDNPKRIQLSSHFLDTKFFGSKDKMHSDNFESALYLQDRKSQKKKIEKQVSIQEETEDVEIDLKCFFKLFNRIKWNNIQTKVEKKKFIQLKKENIREKFQFITQIGSGSYGRVFKAVNKQNGDLRAIKIIKKNDLMNHLKQIEILKQCDHPHIIQLYEIYEYQQYCYIVMELCTGQSILRYLSRKNIQKLQYLVRNIAEQLLQVISYLQEKDIAHRDIKVENIVLLEPLKEDLSNLHIKLIDFGSASKMAFKVNRDKSVNGTIVYMPPQAFDGWYSKGYDMWSFGVLLFLLLSGKLPFKGPNKDCSKEIIKNTELNFPSERWDVVSENAKQFIKAILQKDYRKRLTPQQCLNFSWMRKDLPRVSKIRRASQKLTRKFTFYSVQNSFVSVIESYLTFLKTTNQERKEMLSIFKLLDFKKKGTLSKEDITEAYEKVVGHVSSQIISNIVKKIDKNQSGKIDFSEFQTAMMDRKKLFAQSSLCEAFDFFDKDRSGYIERKQLKQLLQSSQNQQRSEVINDILEEIDTNKDDKISREEFLHYFIRIQKQ